SRRSAAILHAVPHICRQVPANWPSCTVVLAVRDLEELALRHEYLILGAMEYFFVCPYCGERISMVLDTSVKGQTYVEDCEVCCQPIEVRYTVKDDEV